FEDLLSYRGQYYYWQSFIMVAAHAKGYTYKEVETLFEPRRAGKSFLDNAPLKPTLRSFVDREPPIDRSAPEPAWRQLYWGGYLSVFGATHWMMTKEVGAQLRDLRESQWLAPEK